MEVAERADLPVAKIGEALECDDVATHVHGLVKIEERIGGDERQGEHAQLVLLYEIAADAQSGDGDADVPHLALRTTLLVLANNAETVHPERIHRQIADQLALAVAAVQKFDLQKDCFRKTKQTRQPLQMIARQWLCRC